MKSKLGREMVRERKKQRDRDRERKYLEREIFHTCEKKGGFEYVGSEWPF